MKNSNTSHEPISQKLAAFHTGRPVLHGTARVLGQMVRYRMYRVKLNEERLYLLRVIYDGEAAECLIGCDRQKAVHVFFSLLRGRVTPCSMPYIVKELMEGGDHRVLLDI